MLLHVTTRPVSPLTTHRVVAAEVLIEAFKERTESQRTPCRGKAWPCPLAVKTVDSPKSIYKPETVGLKRRL